MQANGETNADTCAFDDLALVMIDPADVGKVNPSIPFWVGPPGLDADGTVTGERSSATATAGRTPSTR